MYFRFLPPVATGCHRHALLLVAIAVAAALMPSDRSKAAASPVPATLRAAIVKRMLSLQSIDVEYSEIDDFTPSQAAIVRAAAINNQAYVGKYESVRRFSFLTGMVRYGELDNPETIALQEKTAGVHGLVHNIFILSKTRFEIFSQYDGLPATGLIGNPTDHGFSNGVVVDVALGLRGDSRKAKWITAGALGQAKVENDPASPGDVILTLPSEVFPLNTWWFRVRGDDIAITKYTYASAAGEVYREIDCDDFRQAKGRPSLPFKMVEKIASRDPGGQPYCGETISVIVRQYHPEAENTPDKYLMVWPLETRVFDQRTQMTFLVHKSPRTLDDDFIAATSEEKLNETEARLKQIATRPALTTQP